MNSMSMRSSDARNICQVTYQGCLSLELDAFLFAETATLCDGRRKAEEMKPSEGLTGDQKWDE